MYLAIDAKDTNRLVSYMTDDAIFTFANIPSVEGKSNISGFLDNFFNSIKAISHTEIESWQSGKVWFVTGKVTYTRHNDSILKAPFGVMLKMNGNLVKDYQIFVDASELYKG